MWQQQNLFLLHYWENDHRNSFWFLTYECIKVSTIAEKADDFETYVITEGNRLLTALYTVWCSDRCDFGLCVNSLWLVTYGCIKTALLGKWPILRQLQLQKVIAHRQLYRIRSCPVSISAVPPANLTSCSCLLLPLPTPSTLENLTPQSTKFSSFPFLSYCYHLRL
jgi:hypothetical protein